MKTIGVYIHIPFCKRKCLYCDFLSFAGKDAFFEAYTKALITEIRAFFSNNKDYIADSVFFGGGTPSLLSWESIAEILSAVPHLKDSEISIECNPGTVDEGKLSMLKNAGVNRISFGLQSANDAELKAIGRIHTFKDFLEAYEAAMNVGFNNINVDIMSAIPLQSAESCKATLNRVARLKPAHISAYSLILEEGTPLKKMADEGKLQLLDEETERQMYYDTKRILSEYGYERYEISNYSHPGKECRHNIKYWTGEEYIGFGLGSASLFKKKRFSNTDDLEQYIANPLSEKCNVTALTQKDMMEEFMFLGLRMTRGVSIEEFRLRFGRHIWNVYGEVLEKYLDGGFLQADDKTIRLTEKGIDVSNVIFSDMLLG